MEVWRKVSASCSNLSTKWTSVSKTSEISERRRSIGENKIRQSYIAFYRSGDWFDSLYHYSYHRNVYAKMFDIIKINLFKIKTYLNQQRTQDRKWRNHKDYSMFPSLVLFCPFLLLFHSSSIYQSLRKLNHLIRLILSFPLQFNVVFTSSLE